MDPRRNSTRRAWYGKTTRPAWPVDRLAADAEDVLYRVVERQ